MSNDGISRTNLSEESEHKWLGFYRAKVIDAHDKRKMGRVKVWIPDLMPESTKPCTEGIWAHAANTPLGGRNLPDMMGGVCDFKDGHYQGSCLIPPAGSWLWIFFENGDPNYPYYFASAETGARKVLPENQQGPEWEKKWTLIKTKSGRCIFISDDEDDCRVEITGKKRQLEGQNPPDGDDASVFTINDNQTVILLDERAGHEKLLLKDHHGNFINMRTDDEGVTDQLHIYMKGDIHIKTDESMYVTTGKDMHIENGEKYLHHSKSDMDIKSDTILSEEANEINRFSMTTDKRTALQSISDVAIQEICRTSGVNIKDAAGCKISRSTAGEIHDYALIDFRQFSGAKFNIQSTASMNIEGGLVANLTSLGPVNIEGTSTNIQSGAMHPTTAFFYIQADIAFPAKSATPANPYGERTQEPNNIKTDEEPPEPVISDPSEEPYVPKNEDGDPYDLQIEPPETYTGEDIPLSDFGPMPATTPPPAPSAAPVPAPATPRNNTRSMQKEMTIRSSITNDGFVGVGHIFAISMKDEYRRQLIPLAKASGATHTGFYLLRDLDPGSDNVYLDDVSVWNNYRSPGLDVVGATVPKWDDWNEIWWERFDEFLRQAKLHKITVVPSLFDFCCSPYDPFLTYIGNSYTITSWKAEAQVAYVQRVVEYLKNSGVDFILNLGTKSYNMNVENDKDLLPDAGYICNLITLLSTTLQVSVTKLSLTANSNRNLYSVTPLTAYKMFTGVKAPGINEINNEEYVDGHWGGTGRVYVYDEDGNLVDGYYKYLQDSKFGIPCMNTWKMSEFDDGSHDMNKIFAPRQREAMRAILQIDGDGSI